MPANIALLMSEYRLTDFTRRVIRVGWSAPAATWASSRARVVSRWSSSSSKQCAALGSVRQAAYSEQPDSGPGTCGRKPRLPACYLPAGYPGGHRSLSWRRRGRGPGFLCPSNSEMKTRVLTLCHPASERVRLRAFVRGPAWAEPTREARTAPWLHGCMGELGWVPEGRGAIGEGCAARQTRLEMLKKACTAGRFPVEATGEKTAAPIAAKRGKQKSKRAGRGTPSRDTQPIAPRNIAYGPA